MTEYPKIHTIWKRDDTTKHNIIQGEYAKEEFKVVTNWHITEKIDGTNVRVMLMAGAMDTDPKIMVFRGRTNKADLPLPLLERLGQLFTLEKLTKQFKDTIGVTLYGEGYGGRIQKGGNYKPLPDFILFDVLIDGCWLEPEKVKIVAQELGIDYVPELGVMSKEDAIDIVRAKYKSKIGDCPIEGIVARSVPLMLFRVTKAPIMWKLKVRDYKI
jgi:ATP-dependent RNA circularization protein (DNA/RNA ligase family)